MLCEMWVMLWDVNISVWMIVGEAMMMEVG